MKIQPILHLCFLLLALVYPACKTSNNIENFDPISKPEIITLYEAHSGQKVDDPDDFCAEKAYSLKGVYALGWFAHDRGCMGSEILVGRKIGTQQELGPKALKLNGWDDKAKQKDLALNWVKEVVLAWESPVTAGSEDFEKADTPDFTAPEVAAKGAGWTVTLWVQEPAGMLPQSDFYRFRVEMDEQGNVSEQKVLERFTVEY